MLVLIDQHNWQQILDIVKKFLWKCPLKQIRLPFFATGYIYLHCAEEDWKLKVILDERDLIIEIKEMYTVTQIVEKLKLELVGKQFNFTTVCVSIRRFLTGLPWEEKGETQLDDMEGEEGRKYNSMTFFVKAAMEEFSGICISYDSDYLIRDVKVFTKYEE